MKNKHISALALMIIATGIGTVFGACTFIFGGYNYPCMDNTNCTLYTAPVPTFCNDTGVFTGQRVGGTVTNVTTTTTRTNGVCVNSYCYGGDLVSSTYPVTNLNVYCTSAGCYTNTWTNNYSTNNY